MKIAIAHYHLRIGGVTRVIEHALNALADSDFQIVVLSGEPPAGPMPRNARVVVVPELAYDSTGAEDADAAAEKLQIAAAEALGGAPDIWHIHNHSLGKNRFLPMATAGFAARGCRLLLQIHDFAEDGRPGNYRLLLRQIGEGDESLLGKRLYPASSNVHYAALNERDRNFLAAAGAPSGQLHLLPNAVGGFSSEWREATSDSRLILYPTRGIRRKNLGEFILWSVVHPNDRFGVTRGPQNPAAKSIHDRWKEFSAELGLDVAFEIDTRLSLSFFELLEKADALATTSVAEGFGLCFLEPWTAGRPLLGRNLPEVTGGITASGVDLSGMYERLDVPAAWVGETILRRRIAEGLGAHLASYGRQTTPEDAERAYNAFVHDGNVDFGRLDEPLQESVIRKLKNDPAAREALRPARLETPRDACERTARNREVVEKVFSLGEYGKRLSGIYTNVAASSVGVEGETLSSRALLDAFLDPARFNLLLTHA